MFLSYMITSTLYMMNSEGKHIYFLKMSLTKGSLTDFNCNLRQTRKTFVAVVAAGLIPGAPNDGFLLNTLKTLFRLPRVLLDL